MSLLASTPLSSRVLVIALIIVSTLIFLLKVNTYRQTLAADPSQAETLEFHSILVPALQLIPRFTILHPWVLLTSIFAETNLISFAFVGCVLSELSRYVEKFWGYQEVIKFVLIIGTATNLFTVLSVITWNIIRGDVPGMFKPLGGGISYVVGFLVVFKQLVPEHNLVFFKGLLNFRLKQVPFILLTVLLLWSLLVSRSVYPALPSLGAFFISYIYLRFFQVFAVDPLLPIAEGSSLGTTSLFSGDASDTFKLIEFFPSVTHPFLDVAFDAVYNASVYLGVVTPFNEEAIEQSNLRTRTRQKQSNKTNKSVANSVAERRRQVALQVIEERINKESTK